MKLIKRLLILLVVLVLGVVAVGWLLPSHYSVERAIVSQARPEKLYAIVADLKTWEDWTAWNKQLDPTLTRTFAGPASGAGSSMAWDGKKTGQGEFKFTEAAPPVKIVYALSFEHGKYLSTGVFTFETNPKGTVVRWTNEGDLGLNPISRWMGLFMDRLMGDDFAKGLTKLAERAAAK